MIKIKNLSKTYGNHLILSNINLNIPLNQLTFIVGESGSGKTTLLNIINNTDKDAVYENIAIENKSMFLDFENIHKEKLIYLLSQDFNLLPDLSVIDNILVSKEIESDPIKIKDVKNILNDFNVDESIYYQKTKNISPGEQQIVSIIIALIKKRRLYY